MTILLQTKNCGSGIAGALERERQCEQNNLEYAAYVRDHMRAIEEMDKHNEEMLKKRKSK